MKTFLAILAILATIALAASAVAQGYSSYAGATTILAGTTNVLPVLSTNGFHAIDVPKSENVALFVNYKFHAAPSAGDINEVQLRIFRGIDPATFETNAWYTFSLPGNSTTPISWTTNLFLGATPAIRCRFVNVSTNAIATNVLFSYGFKR